MKKAILVECTHQSYAMCFSTWNSIIFFFDLTYIFMSLYFWVPLLFSTFKSGWCTLIPLSFKTPAFITMSSKPTEELTGLTNKRSSLRTVSLLWYISPSIRHGQSFSLRKWPPSAYLDIQRNLNLWIIIKYANMLSSVFFQIATKLESPASFLSLQTWCCGMNDLEIDPDPEPTDQPH